MDPTLAVSITYSIIGIAPAIAILLLYKSAKPKYYGLLIFGFMLIILGMIILEFSTRFISIMEDWLLKQKSADLITDRKEALLNLNLLHHRIYLHRYIVSRWHKRVCWLLPPQPYYP